MSRVTTRLTILGCGSSGGVPRIGNIWGACNPANPRNRRRRCSVLVERTDASGTTRVLVDTSPDLREQLLSAGVETLDAVVYTHEHADHAHGIDDLRVVAYNAQAQIDVYMEDRCWEKVGRRFDYCFQTPAGSSYPPILTRHRIEPLQAFTIGARQGRGPDMEILPLKQIHGAITSMGYRFGPVAYCTDLNHLPDESAARLQGLDTLVIDALRYTDHPTHFNVATALEWIKTLSPRRAFLTNLHIDLDYDELEAALPAHVKPAHDGLVIIA